MVRAVGVGRGLKEGAVGGWALEGLLEKYLANLWGNDPW